MIPAPSSAPDALSWSETGLGKYRLKQSASAGLVRHYLITLK